MSTDYFCVGKVKDAHGIRGEIYVHLFSKKADWLPSLETLFLNANSEEAVNLQELEIERVRPHKDGLIIKPTAFADRNKAEEYKGFFMHIPTTMLTSEPGENIFLHEILGFSVETAEGNSLGLVRDFSNNGAHDMIVVESSEKKIELPFVEAFIVKIDYEQKKILMNLPEGLTDL